MKIAFLGLGSMGQPMAKNLIASRRGEVVLWNRTRARAEAVGGAVVAGSPAEAVRGADVVVTVLADDAATEAAGVAAAAPRGAVHVCMATISVALSARLAAAHAAAGQSYVAAPVFGRPEAAAAAKLWIVAAGPREAIERVRPVLEPMGQGILVAGEQAPAANVIKLAGNFMIASMIEALGEAFALARKSGVEAARLQEVFGATIYKMPLMETYGRLVGERRFSPAGFRLALGLKDMRLVQAAADGAGVPMPLASLLHDHFLSAVARGRGEADWSAIAGLAAEAAGLD